MSVTMRRVSVTVCRVTPGCSVKSVRKITSPTAPSAACPAHVTPSVPTAPAVTAQGCVSVRRVYTGPSVTTAILDSSTSAAQDVNRANATTTLPTATLSQVFVWTVRTTLRATTVRSVCPTSTGVMVRGPRTPVCLVPVPPRAPAAAAISIPVDDLYVTNVRLASPARHATCARMVYLNPQACVCPATVMGTPTLAPCHKSATLRLATATAASTTQREHTVRSALVDTRGTPATTTAP